LHTLIVVNTLLNGSDSEIEHDKIFNAVRNEYFFDIEINSSNVLIFEDLTTNDIFGEKGANILTLSAFFKK
jgi:hypothetical protein